MIRSLRPDEAELLSAIHARLSSRSRMQRYLGPKPTLTPADIALLTAVDGRRHVALVALAGLRALPIGTARYVTTPAPDVAEIAIEVVDEWQHRGVGRLLLDELRERARAAGVRRFTWTAFASNAAVAALSRGASDTRGAHVGDGVARSSAAIA